MAEKKTLQHNDSNLIYILLAVFVSLILSWVFLNNSLMATLVEPQPSFTMSAGNMFLAFLLLAFGIVGTFYFPWKKKWRLFWGSLFCVLVFFLFHGGGVYNPSYLYYFLESYSYSEIPFSLYIQTTTFFASCTICIFALIKPGNNTEKGVHGTAEIQHGDDYIQSRFKVGGDGEIIIGRHKKSNKALTFKGDKHLVTMAPTRSGKGVGSIIPNLLHYPYSVVVVDPKGENCNFTSEHRQNKFGQNVICLDPFRESVWGKENGTNHFNPLDAIGKTYQKAFRPCNSLVETIFAEEIKGDPFWIKRAKSLYLGFLTYICCAAEYNDESHPDFNPTLRNLSTVNHLFSIPAEDLMAYIHKISIGDEPLNVKKFANEFLSAGASVKMLIGIMETLKGEIQLFQSPEISEIMSHSDFSFDEAAADNSTTIYLIVPPEELRTYSKWTRIMLTMFIQRAIYVRKRKLREASKHKILFLMDEFTNLGKLNVVRDNYSIAGGYGLKFWIIFQDLGQLKPLYKDSWTSFFSNADIIQVFGVNDIDTADYVSRTLGETTIVSYSKSDNKSKAGGGSSTSRAEQKRRLYNPDEIKRFPRNLQFLIVNGENPIIAKKITFYNDSLFKPLTPSQEKVFKKLSNLPQEFDIKSDVDSIESQLRMLIHGNFDKLSSSEQSEGQFAEKPFSILPQDDKEADSDNDLNVSMF